MNNLYDFSDLINDFNKIIEDIKSVQVSSICNIPELIKDKMLGLGINTLQAWLYEKIGTGQSESIINKIDEKNDKSISYRFNGFVEKVYVSCLGQVPYKRAYYYNNENKGGFFPIEEKYPVLKEIYFPEVKELICYTCSIEPYELASKMLEKIGKIKISAASMQKVTKNIGNILVTKEDQKIEKPDKYKESVKKVDLMAISMDGAMINTKDGWKEVKTGVVYELKEKNGKLKSLNKSYISRIENCNDFSKRIKEEARRRHYLDVNKLIVIGDGARWIWDLAEKEFTNCVQIVDWYHATEHLWKIIELLYGNRNNNDGKEFEKRCEDFLFNGFISLLESEIIDKIEKMNILENSERRESIISEIEYFKKNEKRMKYDDFKKLGYPIGSGIIEAACKHLVQIRMKRNSMKWKNYGAHCILQLRCLNLSNRWTEVKQIIYGAAA